MHYYTRLTNSTLKNHESDLAVVNLNDPEYSTDFMHI